MESPEHTLTRFNNLYGDNALKVPFRLDRTDRPGRPYSVILYGTIQGQKGGAAHLTGGQVVALQDPPGLCPNINRFHGVLFPDPAQIREAIAGIPSIVTDFVKYGSLDYTEGKDFGVQQLVMHLLGLVHGDVQPDTFCVTEDSIVKIIDFGLKEHTGLTTLILPCYRSVDLSSFPNMDTLTMLSP
ncbi:hypothetical protein H1R20_g6685, partial [Candolleomyces eurysporus]